MSSLRGIRTGRRSFITRQKHTITSIFSNSQAAEFLAGAQSAASIPDLKGLPEVIVTGRANCGKSSLFNAVLGRRNLLRSSQNAGHTRQLNFYRVGPEPGKLVLVDTPGYGQRGRPEWGALFNHYVETRKELRRVYILFHANHGITPVDSQMLAYLSSVISPSGPLTFQAVITKADIVPIDKVSNALKSIRDQLRAEAPLCLPPIVTSYKMSPPYGIDRMRENIAGVCGLDAYRKVDRLEQMTWGKAVPWGTVPNSPVDGE